MAQNIDIGLLLDVCCLPTFVLTSLCVSRGVVTVEAKLDYLDINQCPAEFHSANSFKNTARCHFESQYVSNASTSKIYHFQARDIWLQFLALAE